VRKDHQAEDQAQDDIRPGSVGGQEGVDGAAEGAGGEAVVVVHVQGGHRSNLLIR
jgi:hypothetical protein